ncbi:ABC-three component system protein [Hymenobacter negativus]|uniref:ABC-three component systems C-terminal domain-containing protein n=1 Tax=Hymenobacter negativus TaxID=2795026 RepID=A0ABS0Q5H2_9BACT|nr:ABC-three component system protein [Hymenobacter negativus]MBH8557908.1 hypothetical protein [Hymenobacter negativus]
MFGVPPGTRTSQDDIRAGRDNAGRDIRHETTINNYSSRSAAWSNKLVELGMQYLEERAQNLGGHRPLIDKLEHYSTLAEDEVEVIGLEQKLVLGGYSSLYGFAVKTKEMFVKHLTKHQFSEAAQKMYAILLVETYACFEQHVYPSIVAGLPAQQVMYLVEEHVYIYLEEKLGSNVLDLYKDEICGMLYFLTGNCHIKWH